MRTSIKNWRKQNVARIARTTLAGCCLLAIIVPLLVVAQTPGRSGKAGPTTANADWTQGGRFQMDRLNGRPMTEIVRIDNGQYSGTGFFGQNCTVVTALHVLVPEMALEHGTSAGAYLFNHPERKVDGETFDFVTEPVPPDNVRLKGHFTVLAHGKLTDQEDKEVERSYRERDDFVRAAKLNDWKSIEYDDKQIRDDWAVGVDPDCLSKTAHLGYFYILDFKFTPEVATIQHMMLAGYAHMEGLRGADGKLLFDGSNHLYIDSKCHLVEEKYAPTDSANVGIDRRVFVRSGGREVTAIRNGDTAIVETFKEHGYVSNCSGDHGASGGPFFYYEEPGDSLLERRAAQRRGTDFFALGIDSSEASNYPELRINGSYASALCLFEEEFFEQAGAILQTPRGPEIPPAAK